MPASSIPVAKPSAGSCNEYCRSRRDDGGGQEYHSDWLRDSGGRILCTECSLLQNAVGPHFACIHGGTALYWRGARHQHSLPVPYPARTPIGTALQKRFPLHAWHGPARHCRPHTAHVRRQVRNIQQRIAARELRNRRDNADCAVHL